VNPSLQKEQIHLEKVVFILVNELKKLAIDVSSIEKKYKEGLKEASETGRQDEAVDIIKELNKMMDIREYAFKRQFLDRIKYQTTNPYFARIDAFIKGKNIPQKVYIGKHAHLPKEREYWISDWRSPVASLYYNYNKPTKDAKYEFMIIDKDHPWLDKKQTINCDLNLRRTFDIENGKLINFYDNSLRIDLLGSALQHKSGGVLEDIVETIQSIQNDIIRSSPNKVCVVQGVAGSGKTTIAIHRLSYLFYTYKDIITESNTLLLTSSKVLAEYISKTLPELEIYSLKRGTLQDYLVEVIKENNFKIQETSILSSKREGTQSNLRNTLDYINEIDKFEKKYKSDLITNLKQKDYISELNLDHYLKLAQNKPIHYILKLVLEDLIEDQIAIKERVKYKDYVDPVHIGLVNSAIRELTSIQKGLDAVNIYKDFITSIHLSSKFEDIKFHKNFDIDDISTMFLLLQKLSGIEPLNGKFKHIVIDEGQDLGILNYECIKNISSAGQLTILGDLNQAANSDGAINDWNDLEQIFEKYNIDYFQINTSYRTTTEIIKFARNILEKFKESKYLPEPFSRNGENPKLTKFDSRESLLEKTALQAKELFEKEKKAIAIIEPNKSRLEEVNSYLKIKGIKALKVTKNFDDFSKSAIYLVSSDLVKGLEFDTVFLIDPNEMLFKHSPKSARSLYVCCTRAINRLYINYLDKLNPLLDAH